MNPTCDREKYKEITNGLKKQKLKHSYYNVKKSDVWNEIPLDEVF